MDQSYKLRRPGRVFLGIRPLGTGSSVSGTGEDEAGGVASVTAVRNMIKGRLLHMWTSLEFTCQYLACPICLQTDTSTVVLQGYL